MTSLSQHLCCYQVLVIIDAKPKDLGLPTDAYVAVEEVHDVSLRVMSLSYRFIIFVVTDIFTSQCIILNLFFRMELQQQKHLSTSLVR